MMKKQLFICLLAAVFLGFCGVVCAEESAKESAKEGKGGRQSRRRDKQAKRGNAASAVIWAKYSNEIAELRKLRKEDPEAFKAKSKAFREKVRIEVKAERVKFRKLVMEYRKTQDPKALEAIKKYMSGIHDRKIEAESKRVEMLKKRLKNAEKKLVEAKAKKEEKINKILKTVFKDPKLNW